ncbi:hypothetical protein I546_7285, partial [Mycobacterium kansasii 732]
MQPATMSRSSGRKDRGLLLALASGPDLVGLYNWWK